MNIDYFGVSRDKQKRVLDAGNSNNDNNNDDITITITINITIIIIGIYGAVLLRGIFIGLGRS